MHERGDTWAEATEGSDVMGGIWARERYDWSTRHRPGHGRGVKRLRDRDVGAPRAEPNGKGGSRVTVVNDQKPKGKGKISALFMTVFGRRVLSGHLRKTLAILEQGPDGTPSSEAA